MSIKVSTLTRNAIFEEINNINLSWGLISGWDHDNTEILEVLILGDVISKNELLDEISKRIILIARKSFQEITPLTPPDHVSSTQALAFGILHNALSDKERSQIIFDHGEDFNRFVISERPWELPAKVLDYILTGAPPETS